MSRPETERRVRAAGERLLAGTPLRTDGALTVQNLIRESEVGNGTIYRSAYLDEFKSAAANLGRRRQGIDTLRQELTDLRRASGETIGRLRADKRRVEAERDDLRQLVQVLALEREQILRPAPGHGAVTPIGPLRRGDAH